MRVRSWGLARKRWCGGRDMLDAIAAGRAIPTGFIGGLLMRRGAFGDWYRLSHYER